MKSQIAQPESTMPLARFERLDPTRRERLIAAAAREFAFEGYEAASLGRIAEEIGVSKPSLYYYFEDKADLYATVVREAWRRLSPQGHVDLQSLDRTSFWPALEAFHLTSFERSRLEPWLIAVWKLAYHPPPSGVAASAVAEVFERGRAFLKALVRRGQELGVVRTDLPEELLIAVFTGADDAADHWLVDHWDSLGPVEVERLSRRAFDTMRGLLAPPARPAEV
jgi:AcrR family transcriptional regulator